MTAIAVPRAARERGDRRRGGGDAQQLAAVRAHGLYGLYQGVPRTAWSADAAPLPSKITIFRGPLVRANRTPERLATAVADTVYHEIAHHLGISDAWLHDLARDRTERR